MGQVVAAIEREIGRDVDYRDVEVAGAAGHSLIALQRAAGNVRCSDMRITRNPYHRAAAGCALLALIASLTAYPPASVPILALGLAFALRAR